MVRLCVDMIYTVKKYLFKENSREPFRIHASFISNTFISNVRVKLAKNRGNAKQHLEVELLLFENYSHSSYTLSSKIINRTCSKK